MGPDAVAGSGAPLCAMVGDKKKQMWSSGGKDLEEMQKWWNTARRAFQASLCSFALRISCLAFIYHALLVVAANYIPNDAFAAGLTAYNVFAAMLSTVGILGALMKHPRLIGIFAMFHLVDGLFAAVARLVALQLFMDAFTGPDGLCAFGVWDWQNRLKLLELQASHDVVTSTAWQREHTRLATQAIPDQRWTACRLGVGAIQFLVTGVVLGMAMLQTTLALEIRRCGKTIKILKEETQPHLPLEKNEMHCGKC